MDTTRVQILDQANCISHRKGKPMHHIKTNTWCPPPVSDVQILDETDCISHSTNTLGKGMNQIILPPAIGRLGSTALVRQLVEEKENSEFKPVKLHLKIDLVSYPARAEGLVKYA